MRGFHAWSDYLHQQALGGGKEPIYINLDETALSMSASDSKGLIVHKKWWGNRLRPGQRISLSRKRRMVTHVCMVTGNSQLQPELPQVFIGNHRCFSEKDLHDVAGAVPGSVQFWRKKSSWNTSALMCEILNEFLVNETECFRVESRTKIFGLESLMIRPKSLICGPKSLIFVPNKDFDQIL